MAAVGMGAADQSCHESASGRHEGQSDLDPEPDAGRVDQRDVPSCHRDDRRDDRQAEAGSRGIRGADGVPGETVEGVRTKPSSIPPASSSTVSSTPSGWPRKASSMLPESGRAASALVTRLSQIRPKSCGDTAIGRVSGGTSTEKSITTSPEPTRSRPRSAASASSADNSSTVADPRADWASMRDSSSSEVAEGRQALQGSAEPRRPRCASA